LAKTDAAGFLVFDEGALHNSVAQLISGAAAPDAGASRQIEEGINGEQR
jgi:hypothetical protein